MVLISAATRAVVLSLLCGGCRLNPFRARFSSVVHVREVVDWRRDHPVGRSRGCGSAPISRCRILLNRSPIRCVSVRYATKVRMHLPDLINMTADPRDPMSSETVDAINIAITKDTKGGNKTKGKDRKNYYADAPTAETFAQDLATRLPGLIVRPTAVGADRAAPFIVLERFHLAIAIVTVIASSIFLLALMLMLVDERRSTVGILRLIGCRRRRILLYVFVEGLIIAAAGAAIGIVIAARFRGVNQFFQWRYDTALVFVRITPAIALRSISMAAARRFRGGRFLVDSPAARRVRPDQTMNVTGRALVFAGRDLLRQPGRASVGILGIAAVGALLLDMLLLASVRSRRRSASCSIASVSTSACSLPTRRRWADRGCRMR